MHATSAFASDTKAENRRPNLPRGSVDDLQRGAGCVELLASLVPDGVSDKKPSSFVDAVFHPLRPWVAAVEPKGFGVVWDYESGEVVTEFDLGDSQAFDDDDAHDNEANTGEALDEQDGVGMAGVLSPLATPKGLLSRATASPSTRAVQGAVTAGASAVTAAKGVLSPTGAAAFIKSSRKRQPLRMLFYDHESIACTTQLAAPRTCFDEWLIVLTPARVVLCDLGQNGALHHLEPEDLQRGLPTSVAILPSGLLAIGCQDGKIRIWSPWQSKTVGILDSGSQRDVQQLVLLTTPPIVIKRSGSGSLPSSDTRLSTQVHHLVCATLDGRVVTWRVTLNAATASCDCLKTSETELKDAFRPFDTASGVHELKFHPQHDLMTAACRDGTVFLLDVAPLLDHNKPPTLAGVLPCSKLQSIVTLPGAQKGNIAALSMGPLNSTLLVSELVVKGRYSGKDNTPSSFAEFTVSNSQESRDLRSFFSQVAPKKLKLLWLASSARNPGELCCITNCGLLVLRASCLATPSPVLVARGAEKAPALAFPSSMLIGMRVLGEDPHAKPQNHVVQEGAEPPATVERLRVPQLHLSPSPSCFLAAILPVSGHLEIVQLGLSPVAPKTVDMQTIFVAYAFAIAWHPTRPRFAVLAPPKELVRKLTRSNTSSAIVTRRPRFFFGGSRASAASASDETTDAKQQRAAARTLTLSVYDLTGDDAQVEFVETSFASGEDHVLHIFSGPLLGIVKYAAVSDGAASPTAGEDGKRSRDSPLSLSRIQRAQSYMLGALSSPKTPEGRLTMGSPANASSASLSSPTAAGTEALDSASDLAKTYLEFYEWGAAAGSAEGETVVSKLRGGFAVDCPLTLEWESATRSFCALVYPSAIKIYRITANSVDGEGETAAMECLHEISTPSPALSLLWVHHTLFFSTEDEVKCCVVSRTRCFTLALASRWVLNEASCATHLSDDDLNQFPRPQIFPAGATTILGVRDQQLVLGGPLQTVHLLDLSNRVLQCALLITTGSVDQAAQMAQSLSPEAVEWVGAVFEAFGFVAEAMQLLPGLSLGLKINMCIKHSVLEPVAKQLDELLEEEQGRDSPNLSGSSLFQRACVALHRGGEQGPLKALYQSLLVQNRHHDAIFVATLLQNEEHLIEAYSAAGDWGAAFHAAKVKTSSRSSSQQKTLLQQWDASVAKPTAEWRTTLEEQGIRPPETLRLIPSADKMASA